MVGQQSPNKTTLAPYGERANGTNILGYTFKDYLEYQLLRTKISAFMEGANSNYYSPNISRCAEQSLNVAQYDWELLVIKYMYGNTKENILNSTLFLQNASKAAYTCIDGAENLFVFAMYKYELFGFDQTNLILGFIQNLLGNILTINKIFTQVVELGEKNNTFEMYS